MSGAIYSNRLYALASELVREEGCSTIDPEHVKEAAYHIDVQTVKIGVLQLQAMIMRRALVRAREFISTDCTSLAESSTAPDGSIEPDDAAALADYDQALLQIDQAIKGGGWS